ncbi:PBP1A family penicillin-binding protein [Microvenator marinus]|uniref:PBP1A family penicillin-binding protein n=1 Tax=Microvenator marinus TaxID=2600177 RepID=A0A5B8XQV8_9DELT|nr:PBP1A family penicillin-binding protein [Microvenator marinus]QED26413.1 PBP1A family penicillin-binding protein [Microvenator marinus]
MIKSIVKWIGILAIMGALAGVIGLAGIFYYYGRDLPEILKREDFDPPQMTRILSAEGHVIGEFFTPGSKRTVVGEEVIPQHVKDAFMAAEDADFMVHEGIDYLGMVRAFYYAVRYDQGVRGTSTITQQVVKNLVLSPEKSLARKVKEIILARELEKNLTKEDILYLYLNTIYLGHGVNGVEEASRQYFGKSVKDVTMVEGALLAGLTQSPERLTPRRHPEAALKRRAYVLKQLRDKGFINEAEYREAEDDPIKLADRDKIDPYLGLAPHFVEHVRKSLVEKYGEEKVMGGGLRVRTTLEVERQKAGEAALRKGLEIYDERHKLYRPLKTLKAKEVESYVKNLAKKWEKGTKVGDLREAVITGHKDGKLVLNTGSAKVEFEVSGARALGEDKLEERYPTHSVLRLKVVDPEKPTLAFRTGPEAALIAIDPKTRHVVSHVGGYDFGANQYDHVSQAKRQTGSSFKPIVYSAAIEAKTISPASIYLDSPTVFQLHGGKNWSPKNSDGNWRGPIRIREAIGASRNVVSVRVLQDLTIEKAQEFAKRIGMDTPLVDNFTMVMGSTEMTPVEITNAYATFASGGATAEPLYITQVRGRDFKEDFRSKAEQAIPPEVAYLTTSLLRSVVEGYTSSDGTRRAGTASSLAEIKRPVAGKTGTTNEAKDAWFIGYTPDLVTGVWVGYSDNTSLGAKEYGGKVAAPIWLGFMKAALKGEPKQFEEPSMGIVRVRIDPVSGKRVREGGIEEVFLVGTAPTEWAPSPDAASADEFLLNQFDD